MIHLYPALKKNLRNLLILLLVCVAAYTLFLPGVTPAAALIIYLLGALLVLFSQASIFDTVGSDPLWQGVTAIAKNQYYEVPVGPYNWMGFPPSVQRLLGMMWMGKLLYPEAAEYDLQAEVTRYFDLFYHCELTQEQYDALVAHSIGR